MKDFPTTDAPLLYITALVQRIEGSPWYAKAAASVGAVFSLIVRDILFGAVLLAAAASFGDWYYGRAVAYKQGRYSQEIAHAGWQAKGGSIFIILLVRGLEIWLAKVPEPLGINTLGVVSTFLAIGLFVDELDSIDENVRALGGKGIPGLSRMLAWLRAVSGRWIEQKAGTPLPQDQADG